MMKLRQGAALWYAVALILIDFMGLTLTIVTFPKLLLSPTESIFPTTFSYDHKFALMGLLLALYPFGQFFGASVFGKLSDHWGRKSTLLITLVGTLLGFLLTAFSVSKMLPILLFVSRLLAGFFAGNVAVAQAVIIDISDEKTKTRNISFGQTAMGAAWIIGPVFGAYLSGPLAIPGLGLATAFYFFCLIFLMFICFTIFFFADTLAQHQKVSINLLEGVKQICQGFIQQNLRAIMLTWFIFVFGWWLFEAFMPAFLFKHFDYSILQIGNLLTFNGLLFVLSQILIVSQVAKKVKPENLVKGGAIFAALAMISLAYVPSSLIYPVMVVFVLGMSFSLPGFITSISNLESGNAQGRLMGVINSTQAFATVLVMLLGGVIHIFHENINIVGGGLITIVAWLIYLVIFDRIKKSN